jgi:hypothetical protein
MTQHHIPENLNCHDTMTLNFTYYCCLHFYHHHHQYFCCCLHQWLLLFLYFTLIRPKLEYVSVAAYSITSSNTEKFECIQQKFVPLCCKCVYHEDFSYDDPLHTLQVRRNKLHSTFFLSYTGLKNCPSLFNNWSLPSSHL